MNEQDYPTSPMSPFEQRIIMRDLEASKRRAVEEGNQSAYEQNKDLELYGA